MGSRLRGRRISIAVADEALRGTLRRTLEREGALISVSALGTELLEGIASFAPHVCIIDVDLPDLSPATLLGGIRVAIPDLPVILVSAQLLAGDLPVLRDLPLLPVPFSRVQLIEMLEKHLGGRAA